jgi:DNA repair protein SbcC/Rad50
MKILAIRGKNLASLASEFEIDFRLEPLASTGLFAICGPTGAGKSTLLDALSLALYDATPRLAKASGKGVGLPDVRDDTISPSDPRTLLRRGASEGFAEVDFVGNDGIELRARWSVRRARGKSEGKLQNAEISLLRLSDMQPIGNLKSEVLIEIQTRLGLTFQQFTRAVLLAQNEFFAFLKADDNERASLLETLTGTNTYTGISVRAFVRAKAEQEAWERLQEQLADQKPLEAEAHQQLEHESNEAGKAAGDLEKQKAEREGHLGWYTVLEQHTRAEQKAQAEVARTLAEKKAAEPRLAQFIRIEYVQNANPFVTELDRVSAEVKKSRNNVKHAEQQLTAASKVSQDAEAVLTTAKQTVTAAEHARTKVSADLDRAKNLDARIETLLPAHTQVKNNHTAAQKADSEAIMNLKAKKAELDTANHQLNDTGDWLTRNNRLQLLAEGWSRWDMLFSQAEKALSELEAADKALVAAKQDEVEKNKTVSDAAAHHKTVETALHEAEAQHEAAVQSLVRFDPETMAASRKVHDSRRDRLTAAEQLWQELVVKLSRKAGVERTAGEQQAAIKKADAALSAALESKPACTAALEQAARSLKTAQIACTENVETLRDALEENSPCPVCGATNHPYAIQNPQYHVVLDSLKDEVNHRSQEVKEIERREATQKAIIEQSRALITAHENELGVLSAAIQIDTAAWVAHPVAAELHDIAQEQQQDWFTAQRKAVQDQLTALAKDEDDYRSATKAKNDSQARLDLVHPQYLAAQQAESVAKAALEQELLSGKVKSEKRNDIAIRLETALTEIDVAFSGKDWRKEWHLNQAGFHQQQKKQADLWVTKREIADELQIEIGKFETEVKGLNDAAIKATDQFRNLSKAFEQADGDLKEIQKERQGLFAGRNVAEVEGEFAKAIEAAKTRQQTLEQSSQDALAGQARAVEAKRQARESLDMQERMLQTADQALAGWIVDYNLIHADGEPLNLAQLRVLVAFDGEWIYRERNELQKLDIAIERASAVLKERQEQREKHEQACPTHDAVEVVQEALKDIIAKLEIVKARALELGLLIRLDDERLQKSAALLEEISLQEVKTRLWAQLNELIGSADGKKFRNYAQQFTLDVLLGYANRHLTGLSRRYRLERVKHTLALLVVDQDMGDEKRSVHSLSGGESFLVSLALALGLASLSSNRVRVESLFIDEGFGSLDAETLVVAIDALDNLQSQGRKVGVISHVQEMTERIGTQIQVKRMSGGQSRVEVVSV